MNLAFFMLFALISCTDVKETTYNSGTIISISTDKARYELNEPVRVSIQYRSEFLEKKSDSLKIEIMHLEKLVFEETLIILENSSLVEFNWLPPLVDYSGYLVNIYLVVNDKVIDQGNIAIDVSSTWNIFPRYGYLANFDLTSEDETDKVIDNLNRLHLSGFLFYDWQYKHDQPISQTIGVLDDSWLNIANKKVYASKIKAYIDKLHNRNMIASNYNLVYGVYEEYLEKHSEIALYKDSKQILMDKHDLPNTWASDLYLVNPLNKDWQKHFIQMEKEVIDYLSFDIIHLDTLGNRGTLFDAFGKPINMEYALAEFTKMLKSELN
ncbi:MAG: glycoside hydrolase family 66 protein, partial [Ignavibacteria bacterium]|nr:glycoside hydrolase family 66 protein [Ignavibacteria bacterium]